MIPMMGRKTAKDTLERLREIIRKQAEGRERELSHKAIADRLGVSKRLVSQVANELGLHRKPGPKN